MPEKIFVKPREGLLIRDPRNGFLHLPAEGAEVELWAYWTRRIEDGDVVLVERTEESDS